MTTSICYLRLCDNRFLVLDSHITPSDGVSYDACPRWRSTSFAEPMKRSPQSILRLNIENNIHTRNVCIRTNTDNVYVIWTSSHLFGVCDLNHILTGCTCEIQHRRTPVLSIGVVDVRTYCCRLGFQWSPNKDNKNNRTPSWNEKGVTSRAKDSNWFCRFLWCYARMHVHVLFYTVEQTAGTKFNVVIPA